MKGNIRKGVNEQDILESIRRYDTVFLYGAGRYGRALLQDLNDRAFRVKAVVVECTEGNPKAVEGVPVVALSTVPPEDTALFVLAVSEKYLREAAELLVANGHKHLLYLENPFLLHGGIAPEMMAKLPKLEITAKIGCGIACRYCPQQMLLNAYFREDKRRKAYMELSDYKRCILHMPKDAIISFAGFVEPFHHKDAVEMLLFAHEMGYQLELFTTFEGVSRAQYEQIKDIPFVRVELHIPDKNQNARIRTTKEYWEVVKLALEQKKPNGRAFLDKAHCHGEPVDAFLELADGKTEIGTALMDRAGNLKADENLRQGVYKSGKIYCTKAHRQNQWVLLPDGTVTLCCMDFGLKHVIGNLLENTYEELLKQDAWTGIRRQMMQLQEDCGLLCRNCVDAADLQEWRALEAR